MAGVNQSELTKLGREIGHLLRFFIFAVRLSTKLSVSMGSGSLRNDKGLRLLKNEHMKKTHHAVKTVSKAHTNICDSNELFGFHGSVFI